MQSVAYTITFLMFFFSLLSPAQVFQGELDEIYIGVNLDSQNDFENFNNKINNSDAFKFRKVLKEARKSQDTLKFDHNNTNVEISEEDYLKTIRKVANHSNDSIEFIKALIVEIPQLKEVVKERVSYKDLYNTLRPHTLYGSIDSLPDVL